MAKFTWKDRVTSTPHRYRMTQVAPDVYDLEATPGSVSEPGTPLNAENMNALIQRNGDDIKDTVVAFTEAGTRASIATGESTATLFGKIKKWYTDLKTHAFTTPSSSQGTGTTTVPSDKLLKDSSFARVYRSLSDAELTSKGITTNSTMFEVMEAMDSNSILMADISTYPDLLPDSNYKYGALEIKKINRNRASAMYISQTNANNTTTAAWFGEFQPAAPGKEWSGWKQIITDTDNQTISGVKEFTASPIVPTTPTLPNQAVPKGYVDSGLALKAPLANPTFTGSVIVPEPTNEQQATNKGYVDTKEQDLLILIYDLTARVATLEGANKVFFSKSTDAESISAKMDGTSVTSGFAGQGGKQVVITLRRPETTPTHYFVFKGWTKDGVSITSGNDGFVITDIDSTTQTLSFDFALDKAGTYVGSVERKLSGGGGGTT